jgi:hypothetical protein
VILGKQAQAQISDKDEVSSPVCDRSTLPYWARRPLPGGPDLRATTPAMLAGGTAVPDAGSAYQGRLLPILLPEAGDSGTVDGGAGR